MARASVAPPRRKSCGTCVAAKRRCDLAVPFCSRCLHRNTACVYPGQQPSAKPPVLGIIDSLDTSRSAALAVSIAVENSVFREPSIADILQPSESYWDPLQHLHANIPINHSADFFQSSNLELAMPNLKPLRPLSEIIASKMQFAVDVLKQAPSMMVLETQLPWCHARLYKDYMPRAMQDAYSCCSLYMSRNETNTPVIMSLLDARTQDLLSTPQPTTLIDLIARAHALLLYQIMRLFAGDVRSHATSNSLFGTLESTVIALCDSLYYPDPSESKTLLPTSMDPIIELWEWWILQESARRTMLLTFYFIQIYKVLQGDIPVHCDGKLGLSHSWYLSAHLWNAQNAFDFAVAWAERDHFIVRDLDFTVVLETAQPDDVDLFGRMLLVTILGIDAAKAWFYAKGAIM